MEEHRPSSRYHQLYPSGPPASRSNAPFYTAETASVYLTDNMASPEIKEAGAPPTANHGKADVAEIERTISHDDPALDKDHMDFERVDPELAKYANNSGVTISPEEDKRLKRMIDKRVLSIMIFT